LLARSGELSSPHRRFRPCLAESVTQTETNVAVEAPVLSSPVAARRDYVRTNFSYESPPDSDSGGTNPFVLVTAVGDATKTAVAALHGDCSGSGAARRSRAIDFGRRAAKEA
jgi:hypothetical protein